MKTTYLVDSENVNEAWTKLLSQLKRSDNVIIFYTENSQHFTSDSTRVISEQKNVNVSWQPCFIGNNALDFQLVSVLGYQLRQHPRRSYVIISNDTGYDAVIRYWRREGKSLSRMMPDGTVVIGSLSGKTWEEELEDQKRAEEKYLRRQSRNNRSFKKRKGAYSNPRKHFTEERNSQKQQNSQEGQKRQNSQEVQSRQKQEGHAPESRKPETGTVVQEKGPDVQTVIGICRSVSIDNLSNVHEALVAFLGAEPGREMYYFLKDNKEFHDQLKKIYIPDKKTRQTNYLQVVFKFHGMEPEHIEDILGLLDKHRKDNLDILYRSLNESFGAKKGMAFYNLLKPHVGVMRKI